MPLRTSTSMCVWALHAAANLPLRICQPPSCVGKLSSSGEFRLSTYGSIKHLTHHALAQLHVAQLHTLTKCVPPATTCVVRASCPQLSLDLPARFP